MSFTSEVKQETAQKIFEPEDARAELSALIQLTSSLSLSSRGLTILVRIENATVAKVIYQLVKQRYDTEVELSTQKKMNLKKNQIYLLRIMSHTEDILKDLGIYSARGLLDRPLQKIVQKDSCARAYLAGIFLASGSVNSPQKANYHLEMKAANPAHAKFIVAILDRYQIPAKIMERRGHQVVYVKSAEKIADFLRCIEADTSLLEFENIRITRDMANNVTRFMNVDIANEVRAQKAASKQLQDIAVLENNGKVKDLDEKLQEAVALRKENPEASLKELCEIVKKQTGIPVSRSGLNHRFDRIRELAEKERR